MEIDILLIGAGKSSTVLMSYLMELSHDLGIFVKVVAKDKNPLKAIQNEQYFHFEQSDVLVDQRLDGWIQKSKVVISMLPARHHFEIAQKCLYHQKHFISASYVSPEMKSLDGEVQKKGLIFLNECGLDPGLDHMSAMKIIDNIRSRGGEITAFESFTGGLIAPQSDDNPWNYKLTWNPRNVVLAGQGGVAKFKQSGKFKYIPYSQLFSRTELIEIPRYGKFEGYANRDSLKYASLYGLEGAATIYRGTLRRTGYCKAWNKLVLLGMTDDSYKIAGSDQLTYRAFTNLFLPYHPKDSVEVKFKRHLSIAQDDFSLLEKMDYLGLFSQEKVKIKNGSPAQILQEILEKRWYLKEQDKDMIVMWHKFNYSFEDKMRELQSSFVVEGETQTDTAMAKTVGLPLGIAAKLIFLNKLPVKGVLIPTIKSIYEPILAELEKNHGFHFNEQMMD